MTHIVSISNSIISFISSPKIVKYASYEFSSLNTYHKTGFNYSDLAYKDYEDKIVELYFRNSESMVYTTTKAKTLLDLFISISGVPNLLLIISGILLANF